MFSKGKDAKAMEAEARPDDEARPRDRDRLPVGAEAALWSIVEVIPDPRNHLALTRDPTAEVRLDPAAVQAALDRAAGSGTPAAGNEAPAERSGTPASVPPAADPPAAPRLDDDLAALIPETAPGPQSARAPRPPRPTQQPRRAPVTWSSDTAEVRLPDLSGPTPPEPNDPASYARGA